MSLGMRSEEEGEASGSVSSVVLDEELSPTDCSEDSVEIRRRSPSSVARPSAKRAHSSGWTTASEMPEEKRIRLMQEAALLLPHHPSTTLPVKSVVEQSLLWAPFMLGGWAAGSSADVPSYYPPILPYHPFFHPPHPMYLPYPHHPPPPPPQLLMEQTKPLPTSVTSSKRSKKSPPPVSKAEESSTSIIAVKPASALFSVEMLLKEADNNKGQQQQITPQATAPRHPGAIPGGPVYREEKPIR